MSPDDTNPPDGAAAPGDPGGPPTESLEQPVDPGATQLHETVPGGEATEQPPAAAPAEPPTPIRVLGGRYEVHKMIARGGMAEVFLARDRSLDRPVAVKMLSSEFASDPSFVERFRREAQAAANLTHPNIVGVYDWGTEAGTYFIVMEFVEGQSLADMARVSGPLPANRVAEISFAVAGALGFAHARGVVHRDVKPGNVLISRTGQAKVTDFGIARALSAPNEELTQAGSVMGTATYFSPEQAQGFSVDARSDLYSLGVVMFEVLCGRPPFTGETPVAIAYKHVQEAPPRPSSLVAGVPEELEAIVGKLLAKNADARYLSADDLRADLRRFLDGEQPMAMAHAAMPIAGAGAAAGAAAGAGAAATQITPSVGPDETRVVSAVEPEPEVEADYDDEYYYEDEAPNPRTGLFVGLLVFLLLAAGGLGAWFLLSDDQPEPVAATVVVPDVVGMTQAEAEQALRDDGFDPIAREEANDDIEEGVVFEQSPAADRELEEGSQVLIKVSTGPVSEEIPVVAGMTEAEGVALLEDAGFTVKVLYADSEDVDEGIVIGSNPQAGESHEPNGEVSLWVSTGPDAEEVPDVADQSVTSAEEELEDAGFEIGEEILQASDEIAEGRVITTDPAGLAPAGATINLIVSSGPEMVIVPSVQGQPEQAATDAIRARNLEVVITPESLPPGDINIGRVTDQSPDAGELVEPGSTVELVVGVLGNEPTTTTSSTTTTTEP